MPPDNIFQEGGDANRSKGVHPDILHVASLTAELKDSESALVDENLNSVKFLVRVRYSDAEVARSTRLSHSSGYAKERRRDVKLHTPLYIV